MRVSCDARRRNFRVPYRRRNRPSPSSLARSQIGTLTSCRQLRLIYRRMDREGRVQSYVHKGTSLPKDLVYLPHVSEYEELRRDRMSLPCVRSKLFENVAPTARVAHVDCVCGAPRSESIGASTVLR
jgi:hypothetical protein